MNTASPPEANTSAPELPSLRQELSLNPGSPAPDGSPTWTLQDPVGNRFYQLSWPAFEMLSRWSLGHAQALIDGVNSETTLTITLEDVQNIILFLHQHHLLRLQTAEDSEHLQTYLKASKPSKAKWLLKNYLFFRIPLVRPEPLLKLLSPAFSLVFTRGFWYAVLGLLCLGIYLVSRRWDAFIHTFASYSGWQAFISIGLALSFAKILHELGHALTAYQYGCRVPTMGLAFLVLLPVLYTDTNESWKLPSHRARFHIACAGVLAELVLAVCATLLWNFLPDGHIKAGVFLLATSTWLITLAINASPFMRFDGYFLLADHLNMPNLHERALALGRWWWRERLWGFNDPVPEQFNPSRQRFLIAFAIATLIYRAVLFLSIAFLVYHVFFKVLGILLMLVELGWFLAYPVQRELNAWWQRREDIHWNAQTRRSLALLIVILSFFLVPWQNSLRAPAVIMAQQAQGIYTPYAAQVASSAIQEGQSVKAGQRLLQLQSPDLNYQLAKAKAKAAQLRWQLDQQSFNKNLQSVGPALRKRWEGAQQQVVSLQRQIKQLTIRAPFDGIIRARNTSLEPGAWIKEGEQLFYLTAPKGIKGEAFIDESDFLRLQQQHLQQLRVVFVADQPGLARLSCHLSDIDTINVAQLNQPLLASKFGGPIPADVNGQQQLIPRDSRFRLRFNQCTGLDQINRELAGSAQLKTGRHSILVEAITKLVAQIHSQSGF